jgi:hypothetical protein
MTKQTQNAILAACRQFIKPVVRFLLKNGIGYREFSRICKITFVEVATNEFGIKNRKTNMSRVAIMTGLSRKQVRNIRDEEVNAELNRTVGTRAPEALLAIWHSAPEYLDENGTPIEIPFEAYGPSFRHLASRIGGDLPPRALLNELLRTGAVVEVNEKLRAVSRSYVPEPHNPEAILIAGEAMRDLMSTLDHNLSCDAANERHLQRRVESQTLPLSQREKFRRLASERGELLLHDLNSWLTDRELAAEATTQDGIPPLTPRIGIGVYFFDEMPPEDQTAEN